jgi:DNA-binding GntR family transcriptional regulator
MPESKFDLLTAKLRQRILDGEFGTAGRLPPHRQLAQQLGTSRETTNKVLQYLIAEGLLLPQGRSLYVAPPRLRIPALISHYHRYIEEQGLTPMSEFIGLPGRIPAPSNIAQLMRRETGTLVVHRCLKQGISFGTDVLFYRILENFFGNEGVDASLLRAIQTDPSYDVLHAIQESTGLVVARVHNEVLARFPTLDEQEYLGIVRATPILDVMRVQSTKDGEVLAISHLAFIGSLATASFEVEENG